MANRHKTQIAVLDANATHGKLPNDFSLAVKDIKLAILQARAQATRAVRSFRDEYLLELVNLDNVDARGDQDVDERVLSKALVADVEKTIQALGGDDFSHTRRSRRSSRVSGASWRMRGPNPIRSRKRGQHLARHQKEASDCMSDTNCAASLFKPMCWMSSMIQASQCEKGSLS